jgi:hypothetical protein
MDLNATLGMLPWLNSLLGSAQPRTSKTVSTPLKTWMDTAAVDTENSMDVFDPKVAIDAKGNAIAVWLQSDGASYKIWTNYYVQGQGWGASVAIDTDATEFAFGLHIFMSPLGEAVLVWCKKDLECIKASHSLNGGKWSASVEITPAHNKGADALHVAMNACGSAIAIWRQFDGVGASIWVNKYAVGSGWGMAEVVSNEQSIEVFDPSIAMDAAGNAIAIWTQPGHCESSVWTSYYVACVGWTASAIISCDTDHCALHPQIATDKTGNATVVWLDSRADCLSVWTNRYVAGNGWCGAELIGTDSSGGVFVPQIAMDGDGQALAVWMQSVGMRTSIISKRYQHGQGWCAAKSIKRNQYPLVLDPQLVMDANSNAFLVWRQSDGMRYQIWISQYEQKKGWRKAVSIDTNIAGEAGSPQITINSNGNAIVIREQFDDTRFSILANSFQ